MTHTSIESRLRTVEISPALGLIPPSNRLPHNSIRLAPPCSAATADSTESAQISRITGWIIYWVAVEILLCRGFSSVRSFVTATDVLPRSSSQHYTSVNLNGPAYDCEIA